VIAKIQISFEETIEIDLAKPLDISIPLTAGTETVNCFYAPPMTVEPVRAGNFVGSIKEGGLVNFVNIMLNPHGNGTHTECYGHISAENATINQSLRQFHFLAKLISVRPEKMPNGDEIIFKKHLIHLVEPNHAKAIIIRTVPNNLSKLKTNYSGKNAPYFDAEAIEYLVKCGFEHLLTDLPSVDREADGGKLAAHKMWWQTETNKIRQNATITELIFVENSIKDGLYLLNLQITSLEIDATPSKPVIYEILEK
jgi:arylformamidase